MVAIRPRKMNSYKILLFAAGVTIAASTGAIRAEESSENFPSDVIELVGRRAACAEWSRKAFDPTLATQAKGIMTVMQSLKCGDIADDERVLRQKYASDPIILAALKATWVKVVKRLPVRSFAPPELDQ
jgi:hypothetical protein